MAWDQIVHLTPLSFANITSARILEGKVGLYDFWLEAKPKTQEEEYLYSKIVIAYDKSEKMGLSSS